MNNLEVKLNEGTVKTIPSYEVAEMMGRAHAKVIRMLEGDKSHVGIIPTLTEAQSGVIVSDYFIKSTYKDASGKQNKYYECTKLGLDILADKTQGKSKLILKNYINSNFENKDISILLIERKEIEFINQLEQALKPFGIQGEKQFKVLRYRIDYYIPSLNIAIEYDENDHSNYTYEAHEGRQKEIEKELSCRFIRVSDNNTDAYNIGLVIKKIFNINKEEL